MLRKVKLKDISKSIGSGITPLRSNPLYWENGTIPWLKTEQLGESEINDTSEKITPFAIDDTSIKIFPINTLSIAMYGEGRTRGNVSILKAEMTTNQACCNIVIDEEKAYHKYVYYYLKTQYNNLRSLSSGVRKNLNSNDIKEFGILLPETLSVQKRIASILSSIDSKISLNNRVNAELEAMAKTIYDYWFVQFDFPISAAQAASMGKPDKKGRPYKASGGKMVWSEELKREIPEGWEVNDISRYISVKDGTHDSPKYTQNGYKLITSKNLKIEGLDFDSANFISEEDYFEINKRSKVDTGDILFSMIGNIGTIYKVEEVDINFAVKNVAIFKSSEKFHTRNFIYMFLKSSDMSRYMVNTISGSIQKFIGLGDLRKIPVFVENDLIIKYSQITKGIFLQMENVKLQNQKLTELRDWLLPMLMNGQIKIKDAEWEVAMAAEPAGAYKSKRK